jgi:hypothetical protein
MTIHATVHGPLVTLECSDVLAEQDLAPLFRAFEAAAHGGLFVAITDTTQMKFAPRAVLTAFTERLKKAPAISANWLGDAVVVSSAAVRFVLSTLLIVAPMPTEVKAFDERKEANRWLVWLLRRSGLMVPSELLRSA